MNSLVRILLAFALAVCAVTVPSAAHAQGASAPAPTTQAAKDEAQDRFKRGIELYEEENFAAALVEFKRAYELVPAYQVLYNVGRTCYQVRDYVCALRNFSRYLSEGGSAIDAKRKDEVDREIVSMRRRVATVSLTATRGSTISVDGVAIGDAPLATPLQVNEGRRLIRASMVGRESVDRSLEVVGGSTVTVDLTLAESAPSSAPVASTSKSSNTHWWLWGATGVLAVGAGVTGTLALSASGDASDIRSNGGSVSDYESAESRMRTLTVVTDVLALAAIGAGVTALVLTLTSDHQAPSSATAKARPAPGNGAFRFAF